MPVLCSKISVRLYQKAGWPNCRDNCLASKAAKFSSKRPARFAGMKNSHDVYDVYLFIYLFIKTSILTCKT